MQTPPLVYATAGTRCLRALYPLISPDAPITWIHVAMEGTWEGHSAGAFTLDRDVFKQIVRNFDRSPNPVPLDYEHATEYAAVAPACGWVQRLQVREGAAGAELWALTELGDDAAAHVRKGEYRFSSGVFDFGAIDPVSGKEIGCELTSLALTNLPFLAGQVPIRLTRRNAHATGVPLMKINKSEFASRVKKLEGEEIDVEAITKLAQAMGLMGEALAPGGGDEAMPEDPAAEVTPLSAGGGVPLSTALPPAAPVVAAAEPVPAAVPDPVVAPPPDHAAEANSLAMQIMEATGLDLPALIEALKAYLAGGLPAVTAPLSARMREHEVTILGHTHALAAANKRVTDAEAALKVYREREADVDVATLIESGRILDNGRTYARELCLSDRKQFERYVASLPDVVPMGAHASSMTPPTEETPAVNEELHEIKSLRRSLSNTTLPKSVQDAAVVKRMAEIKANNARV